MKEFTVEFLFDPLKNSYLRDVTIEIDDNNLIHQISQKPSTKKLRGFFTAGLINMHTHLEFSWMKGYIPPYKRMPFFIDKMREIHQLTITLKEKEALAQHTIEKNIQEGTAFFVDICNTFLHEKNKYSDFFINFIELFGTDILQAEKRIKEATKLYERYKNFTSQTYYTPHTLFTLSEPLWNFLLPKLNDQPFYSIHFMESEHEISILKDPAQVAIEQLPHEVRVFFVHNTFMDEKSLKKILAHFSDPWFVLCPRSNYYIEKKFPPVDFLKYHCEDRIVLGTDSMASNWSISLWKEIEFLRRHFPHISLDYWLKAATLHAAKALRIDHILGRVEIHKKAFIAKIPTFLIT